MSISYSQLKTNINNILGFPHFCHYQQILGTLTYRKFLHFSLEKTEVSKLSIVLIRHVDAIDLINEFDHNTSKEIFPKQFKTNSQGFEGANWTTTNFFHFVPDLYINKSKSYLCRAMNY